MKKVTRRQFLKTTAAVGALGAAASAGAVPAGACIDPPPATGYPQQITIGAYDWGPCVSSTQFKLRQSVRAESVQASDFQSAYETKDSYDWYQTSAGTATASGTLPVVDACPCNSDGFRAASARMLRLEFSPVKQDANVVGSVFRFDPAQHTTSWCSDYTLSIQLSKDASLSAALFGLPVTKVEVNPAIDFSRACIPALDPFRLDGKFTGSDGRTLLYASYEPSGAVEVPLVVWLHSGEECGSDVRIPLLAEKVSALAGKAFQDALGGSAFVLVPQTSEVWDDAQVLTLRELIEQFAAEHPNLDRTRIYLGGSGAGGDAKNVVAGPGLFRGGIPHQRDLPGRGPFGSTDHGTVQNAALVHLCKRLAPRRPRPVHRCNRSPVAAAQCAGPTDRVGAGTGAGRECFLPQSTWHNLLPRGRLELDLFLQRPVRG